MKYKIIEKQDATKSNVPKEPIKPIPLTREQQQNLKLYGQLNRPEIKQTELSQGKKKTVEEQKASDKKLAEQEKIQNYQKQKAKETKDLEKAATVAPYIIPGLGQAMWAGKAVDLATSGASKGKYKSWGDMVNKNTNSGEFVGDLTNPGYYAGAFPRLVGKGLQSTGKYALKKAEPYLMGDKKIPMMGMYKPKSNLLNFEKATSKSKSNVELNTLFDNNFEIHQRGPKGELPSRIKIKGKSGQLEAVRNTLTGEYMFHNNMPSQLEAGKAMLTLDKYLPKNAVIKETESLSLDSYNNLLNFNRRKGWKLEPTNDYIELNHSHKNSNLFEGISKDANIGSFTRREDAIEAVNRINNMLKQKGFIQQADIKPLNGGYYHGIVIPNFKALRLYKLGGTIHIKPENVGKFTATKKRTGKTTEELTHSKNPITKKRAVFAQNAAKWKHQDGGLLERKGAPFATPKPILPEFPYNGQSMYKGGYNLKRALELYKPDNTGHLPSVDNTNGEWLKDKDYPTSWKELLQSSLNLNLNKQVGFPILNTNGRLQYINKNQNGGTLDSNIK